jgi:hypothetical protein
MTIEISQLNTQKLPIYILNLNALIYSILGSINKHKIEGQQKLKNLNRATLIVRNQDYYIFSISRKIRQSFYQSM